MVNKRSVTLKEKIMYGVLTAVAGTLTVIAFMCVLLSSVAPSFCTDLFPVHTSSVGSLKDNIKVENTAVPMGSSIIPIIHPPKPAMEVLMVILAVVAPSTMPMAIQAPAVVVVLIAAVLEQAAAVLLL